MLDKSGKHLHRGTVDTVGRSQTPVTADQREATAVASKPSQGSLVGGVMKIFTGTV